MSRKGYYSEYKINQMLKSKYPDCDIMRNPIADFMIINKGRIIKIIEVKSIHQKKYYPTPREKLQLARIKEFSIKHNIDSEIWLDRIGKGIEIIHISKVNTTSYFDNITELCNFCGTKKLKKYTDSKILFCPNKKCPKFLQ